MARTKVDVITCDRCSRRLEEADVRAVEFSILYHDPHEIEKWDMSADGTVGITTPANPPSRPVQPAPAPTRYMEVCKRCDTLLRKVSAQAAPPSKPGRKKEKEDD